MKHFIISESPSYRFTMVISEIPKFNIKEVKLISENLGLKATTTVQKYYLTQEEIQNLIKGLSE